MKQWEYKEMGQLWPGPCLCEGQHKLIIAYYTLSVKLTALLSDFKLQKRCRQIHTHGQLIARENEASDSMDPHSLTSEHKHGANNGSRFPGKTHMCSSTVAIRVKHKRWG